VTALTGCSKTSDTNSSTDSGKKSITLTFGSHQSGLPSNGIVQEIAKDYEKETGVKIDFQITPDAQWRDLLKTKLSAGEAPDIFCADADPLSLNDRVRPAENCIDLTGEEFAGRMDKNAVPSFSYQGKVYGISFAGYKVWWYYYNKKMFNDLGLKAPKTYQEFKNVCEKIKGTGVTPIYEALQDGWHQVLPLFETGPYYEKLNPGLYDKLNNNTANVKDVKELKTVLTQLKEFQTLGYFGKDFMSNSVSGDYKAFADGKVAMVLQGFGWEQQLAKDFPNTKDNVGVFIMPFADSQVLGINPASNAYFGNAKSKNKEEILKFFRYLAKPAVLQKRLDGDPSALALCWPEIKPKYPQSYVDYINSLDKGTVMQVGVKYIDPQWMDVGKDIGHCTQVQ
jgi:raffinose/stachyose/melibiose transport system substrate-binding protein